jgi:transposase
VAIDPESLPEDTKILRQMLVDLTRQLDNAHGRLEKTQRLLEQLLTARSGPRSEQLSADQLQLFAQELGLETVGPPEQEHAPGKDTEHDPPATGGIADDKPRGRKPLSRHLKRERVVHDLAEAEKHCPACDQNLRHIGEEVSERYEYIPAQMLVIEDACQKYACACTIRTALKPAQPIEKSTASASVLTQVIVAKVADHLLVHRQAKMFRRFGVELPDQTLCGWLRQSAELLEPAV